LAESGVAGALKESGWLPRAALALIGLILVAGIAAPLISPFDPLKGDILANLKPPSLTSASGFPHLFGTDMLGRDVLSGILHGARVSLVVGIVSVLGAGLIGTAIGILAGYFRGWFDEIVMRVVDVQLAFPFILLAIVIMYVLGRGMGNVIIVLVIASWPLYARVARAQALRLRESEFVLAARSLGAGWPRILLRHVLPNAMTPLLVVATFAIPQMIIFEAALSFLGVGMPVDVISWGSMLASGRNALEQAWWIATLPGIAIMATVLAINILGDWLRDRLDPNLRLS
jgi:peptide/nickel transport system permease protein